MRLCGVYLVEVIHEPVNAFKAGEFYFIHREDDISPEKYLFTFILHSPVPSFHPGEVGGAVQHHMLDQPPRFLWDIQDPCKLRS